MTLDLGNVTFDCHNAAALAEFYARLLDRAVDPDANEFFATVGATAGVSPVLMFTQVPERTPGKNSIHLDFHTAEWLESIEHAVGLGAEHIADFDEYGKVWATLADPEGNLFDIGKD
ncbi:glyoxalase/bleomycin resistance/dioxygenase family protein [Nocardia mangyaensis]|uniref:Glyoxalase/bleomycin resistance/dioxygenase family protein n=1 Tax=Nocardia mangyaensis TaxID=2213200 RepID=A0A1J0VLA9_9NOCA|nr:VOC family protein [Nocardia mangyaensis]APE32827.1 glyoxalase/bleomycin resistance/dioxygenase family protein [Nocardia mangyaensis]